MLILTGLLTLLAIAQGGADGVKGGIKGGSLLQEQVAQEDIPSPYNFNIKTGPAYGTKVARDDAGPRVVQYQADESSIKTLSPASAVVAAMSKKAPAPALHHSVKTLADRPSKIQPVPGLHHAATSPVVQDQVTIDVPAADTRRIKTLKTVSTGKTSFSQADRQVRDPAARPAVQTVKTAQAPVTDSSQGVKTLKTTDAGKTRFSQVDTQVRDPVARPVVQTVKTVRDPTINQQTVKTSTKTAEPSGIRRKTVTKASQQTIDSSSASSAPESVVEAARRNTLRTLVPESASTNIERGSLVLGNEQNVQLFSNSGSQIQAGFGRLNERGELTLDEETIRYLQNAGGIVKENGEITLNEEALRVLQNVGGSSLDPTSLFLPGASYTYSADGISGPQISEINSADEEGTQDAVITRPIIRATGLDQATRVSNQNERQSSRNRVTGSTVSTNQGFNSRSRITQTGQRTGPTSTSSGALNSQYTSGFRPFTTTSNAETILFNGREISVSGLRAGQMFDENLQPISTGIADISGPADVRTSTIPQVPKPAISPVITRGAGISTVSSNFGSSTTSTGGVTRRRQQAANIPKDRVNLRTPSRSQTTVAGQPNIQTTIVRGGVRSSGTAGIRESTTLGNAETILFNGKEISVSGLRAGQMFDENLRPISTGSVDISGPADVRTSTIPQVPKPATSPAITRGAGISTVSSNFGSRTISTGGVTRRRQQAVNIQKDRVNLRTPSRSQPTVSGQPNVQTTIIRGGVRSPGAVGIRESTTLGNAETILFNGKEISVSGLRAGQMFDENLQPISTGSAGISGPADVRTSTVPQSPKPATSSEVTQGGGISTVNSNFGSSMTSSGGVTRRRQQAVNIPKDRVNLRTPSRSQSTVAGQPNVQTTILRGGVRSPGAGGIRQSITAGREETILFNGKEISVSGLRAGQMFDENLQPISTGNADISRPADVRTSTINQIPNPAISSSITRGAGISNVNSNFESSMTSTGGVIRRRQQAVNIPKDRVNLRTPSRSQTTVAGQPNVQTTILRSGVRSPGAGGIRGSTTSAKAETILFNGKEISVSGLRAGQMFDENLRPISTGSADISRPADIRTSTVPQVPKPATSPAITRGAGISTVTSNFGSRTTSTGGVTRRRQQVVNIPKDRVNLRTPPRSQTTLAGLPNVQTSIPRDGLRSPGAAGMRQSITAGKEETILFNGKEISVSGLSAGQMFDENLQPISTGIADISGPADVRTSIIPQVPKPAASPAITRGAGISTVSSNFGSSTTSTGGVTRRRQQAANIPKDRANLRTPSRSQTTVSGQPNVQTTILRGGVRSPGAVGIRESTTLGNAETILFNGKEISVSGLRAGQMFDENLQPISTGSAGISGPADVRTSVIPQVPKPAVSPTITRGAGISTVSSNFGSSTTSTGGVTRRRQQAANIPKDRVNLRTPSRSQTTVAGQPNVQSTILRGGVRSPGAGSIRGSTTSANAETILFNGKEISVSGLRAGQMFDENLQPISTGNADISRPAGVRTSTIPQFPKPAISPAITRGAGISTVSSNFGSSTTSTGGVTRRRQQTLNIPKDRVNLRTGSRTQTTVAGQPNVQNSVLRGGVRSPGAGGIRGSTTSANAETILFNGKEISVSGLRAGQMFDENLQPILTGNAGISQPIPSITPESPKPVIVSGVTQSAAVSAVSTNYGSRRQGSPVRPSSQSGSSVRSGILSSGVVSSTLSETSGTLASRIPASGFSTGALSRQQAFTGSRRLPNVAPQRSSVGISTSQGATLSGGSGLRVSGLPMRQVISSSIVSGNEGQTIPESYISKPITPSNAETILFNGKEISIGGLREGQLFDENLQPILSANVESAKTDDIKAFSITQDFSRAESPRIPQNAAIRTVSTTYGSGVISSGGIRQQPTVNVEKDKPILRTTSVSPFAFPARPNVQSGVSSTSLRSQGITRTRQPSSGINDETIFFNGKEIKISGLRAGQMFDENLQPILSGNTYSANEDAIRTSGRLGSTQNSATSGGRIEAQPQRLSAVGARRSGLSTAGGTMAQGLRSQSLSRPNPQLSGLRSSVISRGGLSPSNPGIPLSTGLRNSQTVGERADDSRTYIGPSISRSSQISSPIYYADTAGTGFTDQSSNSRVGPNMLTGILPVNSGDIASVYTSRSGIRGSDLQGKISRDSVTQEIFQDRVETPVIQEQQEVRVVPQYLIDSQQKIEVRDPTTKTVSLKAPSNVPVRKMSQKTLEPTESKQMQLKVDDIIEQRSLTKPAALKTVQVQETVPFSDPQRTPSKTTFTKISQVSQKDIDIPAVQQRVIAGDFSGYLPKASFLPPFNYGLPVSASKYNVKTPIVQEQQKVVQEFV